MLAVFVVAIWTAIMFSTRLGCLCLFIQIVDNLIYTDKSKIILLAVIIEFSIVFTMWQFFSNKTLKRSSIIGTITTLSGLIFTTFLAVRIFYTPCLSE